MALSRWNVEVSGKAATASLLPTHLPQFSVHCDADGYAFLSHPELERLSTPTEVRDRAIRLIEEANAALAVSLLAPPEIHIGALVREDVGEGETIQHVFVSGRLSDLHYFGNGFANGNGHAPRRTLAERSLALAAKDRRFAVLSRSLPDAGTDLACLQVIYEAMHETLCGGSATCACFAQKGWASASELHALHASADLGNGNGSGGIDPVAAKALVRRLLVHWVDQEVPD